MLGFGSLSTTDNQSGITTTTTYRQDFPYTGLALTTETTTEDGQRLSFSENTWDAVDHGGYWQLNLSEAVEQGYDLKTGDLLKTTTNITTYDDFSNALTITQVIDGGGTAQTQLITNTYTNNTDKWHLGRLINTVVTTTHDGETSTRTSGFTYYDSTHGMLKSETVEPGTDISMTTTYTYDAWGNTTGKTVSGGGPTALLLQRTESTVFSTDGLYANETINALDQTVSKVLKRDDFGRPLQVANSNGLVTILTYDGMGREASQRHADGSGQNTTVYTRANSPVACPPGGVLVMESAPVGAPKTWVIQDKLGREIRKITEGFDGKLIGLDTEYDNLSRAVRVSESYLQGGTTYWNETTYDLLGRVTRVLQAGGHYENHDYQGFNTTITSNSGQVRADQRRDELRNSLGQLVKVTDHLNNTISYTYDPQGNLTQTVQYAADTKKSAVTDITYDIRGRKLTMDDPDKGFWTYETDALGRLTKQTDAKGQIQTFTYDKLDRKLSRIRKQADGTIESVAHWVYDTKKIGQLSETRDDNSHFKQIFHYDDFARPSGVDTTIDGTTYHQSTEYDSLGRVRKEFDAAGSTSGIEYHYNNYGYQNSITDLISGREWLRTEAMDARGNITEQLISGLRRTRAFAPETGFITNLTSRAIGSDLQSIDYHWDLVGNLEYRKDNSTGTLLTETFGYDDLNRLTSSTVGNKTDEYRYDGLGNITFKTGVGDYQYAQNGAGVHAVTHTSMDGASYRYDDNGNMTSGAGRTLTYNAADKALSITKSGHTTIFRYDTEDQRFSRKDTDKDGGVTLTTYIGNVEIITRPNGDTDTKRYINGVAIEITTEHASKATEKTVQILLKDHLGSVHTILDGDDFSVLQRQSFDPFGQRRQSDDWQSMLEQDQLNFDTTLTTRGFTGHEQMDQVGLVNMNGRLYDPRLGRFVQADPFVQYENNTQSYNRYSYVLNNPMNAVDPSGYFLDFVCEAINDILGDFVPFVAIAIAIALPTALINAGLMGKFHASVTAGFISGGVASGSLKGAFVGAFSAGTLNKIGDAFTANGWGTKFFGKAAGVAKTAAHSLNGGVMSVLNGGKFGNGFVSAGFSELASPAISMFDNDVAQVFAGAVVGGTASDFTGEKFANGASTAAFVSLMSAASEYYEKTVGRKASALPGENREGQTTYNPGPDGRQAPQDVSMNVIGHNEPLTDDWVADFGKQGSGISKALNLVPGMNATAGLHDYWLNPGNPSQLPKTFINNYGTMLPAAGISVAASIGNFTRGNETMIMTMYHLDSQRRRRDGY